MFCFAYNNVKFYWTLLENYFLLQFKIKRVAISKAGNCRIIYPLAWIRHCTVAPKMRCQVLFYYHLLAFMISCYLQNRIKINSKTIIFKKIVYVYNLDLTSLIHDIILHVHIWSCCRASLSRENRPLIIWWLLSYINDKITLITESLLDFIIPHTCQMMVYQSKSMSGKSRTLISSDTSL